MRRIYFYLLFLLLPCLAEAQIFTQISHYSVDQGLSENHVLCMLQDCKGMMWFGTYDGLNKFDGYTFRNFKGASNQKYSLVNYRIDRIKEDLQGFIWVQTNDGRVYRFDPSTELFLPVPQCLAEYRNFKSPTNRIAVLNDGAVWLYNSDSGNETCLRVENIETSQKVKVTHLSKTNGDFSSDKILKIYLDRDRNTWILTSKGISLLKKNTDKPIQLFTEDQKGSIFSICETNSDCYIGGEHGKFRVFDKSKGTLDLIETPIESNIIDIQQLNSQELFLLTNTADFYIYNLITRLFQHFTVAGLKTNVVYSCYKDRSNNVWIDGENQGAIKFDTKTRQISYLTVETSKYVNSQSSIFYVEEDKFNTIWVQLRSGGFYKYNKMLNQLECIPPTHSKEESISNMVHTGITDQQGNLWLGTYLQGVDKVVFGQSTFTFTKPFQAPVYTQNNEIRSIFQDSKNLLWVGSKRGSLYLYNQKRELLGLLGTDGKLNSKIPFDAPVYDIMEDHTGTIWLATRGMGLFRCIRKSDNSFSITNYQYDPGNIYSLTSNAVYSVFEDHLNRIWVGTFWGGLNLLDTESGEVRFISNRNKLRNYPITDCSKVRYITEDKQHQLYFCTTQGLLVCPTDTKKPEEIVFKRFVHDPERPFSLSGNDVHYLMISSKGDLYLALIGGGMTVVKGGLKLNREPKFELLRNVDGTSSNLVYTIKEDKNGCLWMSAQTHILTYNPASAKFDMYKPVSSSNYFFDEAAVCQTREGEMIYGTSDGFVTFDPLKIHKSAYVPRICLTQLELFNKPVQVGDNDSPLKQTIDATKELVLTHRQSIFSIEYAALDYTNPHAIQYAYKLEGLENEWNYVGSQRIANYINLPKGRYVFHVKSTNADGEWVDNEKTLVIIKLPSFWESFWGWLFYAVIFILLLLLTTYILFTIYKLRNEVSIEQRITNMKLRFFTDISHELRTPLTLIASPIDNILIKETLSTSTREQLQVVQRNTNLMLRLINQIMDFRKVQSGKMKLIVEVINVADFMNEIRMNFIKLAEDKKIGLKITDFSNNAQLWVDKDKFEKIFFNLLSNAFKFSPTENKIDIIIAQDDETVTITVQDRGVGISKDKLKLLFERFESFAANNTIAFQASTGIGLSLTKELVELHHAKIDVESESGKGSAFKVTFLKGTGHFSKDEEFLLRDVDTTETIAEQMYEPNNEIAENELDGEAKTHQELPKIIIVEDNNELRHFLKSTLSAGYEVSEAENGRIALDMALTNSPDIIISDIMMPDMDGLELTRRLKGDINISHIPLILLTAKTDIESKLEALELGADDYITKPFSMTYLEARVENLLKTRSQLQDYLKVTLAAASGVITLSKPEITCVDNQFMQKTLEYIEQHYEDSEMNIDDIAAFAGVSRSSFFKKIKSLTGLAPVDFVREYRIQKAVQMLEAGETNISQIAYSVGINDTKYFSRCFKQRFGVNPSEYLSKRIE